MILLFNIMITLAQKTIQINTLTLVRNSLAKPPWATLYALLNMEIVYEKQ